MQTEIATTRRPLVHRRTSRRRKGQQNAAAGATPPALVSCRAGRRGSFSAFEIHPLSSVEETLVLRTRGAAANQDMFQYRDRKEEEEEAAKALDEEDALGLGVVPAAAAVVVVVVVVVAAVVSAPRSRRLWGSSPSAPKKARGNSRSH